MHKIHRRVIKYICFDAVHGDPSSIRKSSISVLQTRLDRPFLTHVQHWTDTIILMLQFLRDAPCLVFPFKRKRMLRNFEPIIVREKCPDWLSCHRKKYFSICLQFRYIEIASVRFVFQEWISNFLQSQRNASVLNIVAEMQDFFFVWLMKKDLVILHKQ